jgi:hypothetical protein
VKRLSLLLGAALAVLALVETGLALTGPLRAPRAADWDAAAAQVRGDFQGGDLIVFAPAWADQIGRAHFGGLVTVEMAGRADADAYGRIWEVAIRGAHAPEVRDLRAAGAREHGAVTVSLYRKGFVKVLYDFTTHATDARVTQTLPTGETPCLRDDAGFRCATTRVEPRTLEVDYQPHRGILTPVDERRTTLIAFDDVTLGSSLVGYTGLHDYFSRKNGDGPVDFRLFVDGQQRLSVRHGNSDGWRRFAVETTPGRHAVRFEVSAPSAAWRTFGFHAEARE